MDPRSRNGLIIGGAGLLAVWIGAALAGGSVGLATLALLVSGALVLTWSRWLRPETALLAFVLGGYLIGNRGFAQLMPIPALPVLFGEAVLAITGLIVVVQSAFRRQLPWRTDALNHLLLLLIALGGARMVVDFRSFGFWALRDFATVYYIAYFFITQSVAIDARERGRLGGLFIVFASLLPIVAILFQRFQDVFLTRLTLGGIPFIFMKDDLAATFLLAALFPLLVRPDLRPGGMWRPVIAGVALLVGLSLLSRAAIVGFAVAAAFALVGRQVKWLKLTAIALPLGLAIAAGFALVQDIPWRESRVYALYEHVVSIGDLDGTGRYQGSASTDTGDNNRFRLTWWQSITHRVLAENPVFGLGFGYDLSHDFVATYEGVGDDFAVRSPHSIVFTVLGRTGFVGLALFVGLLGAMVARTLTAAKAARSRIAGAARALSWWCACWVILTSACFGVVLESPMGAIVFWILLGLAHASTIAVAATPAATESEENHDPSLQTVPEPSIR